MDLHSKLFESGETVLCDIPQRRVDEDREAAIEDDLLESGESGFGVTTGSLPEFAGGLFNHLRRDTLVTKVK